MPRMKISPSIRCNLCSFFDWRFYLLQLPADRLLPHIDLSVLLMH